MHLTLKREATKPAADNVLQQQARFDAFVTRYNDDRPHAALDMQGIDALGLDGQDRKYLETIVRVFHGGPVGVEAVAHTLNLAPDTLVDEVEPYLLRSGLLIRTPRGRRVTAAGHTHLGMVPRDPPDPQRALFG